MSDYSGFCSTCGSNEVQEDPQTAIVYCISCGQIRSENNIVSEVAFTEGSNGTSSVVGQFVPASGIRTLSSYGKGAPLGHSRESREETINKAKRRISSLATMLHGCNPSIVESAVKYFTLALTHNFVQGRKSDIVRAACLYVACRRAKTSHMLIDFSDVTSINVFTLGGVVSRLIQTISIALPLNDPSIYMQRFAFKLNYGDASHKVAMTALRLLAHLKRDWIHSGRRPNGVCGGCLYLAARVHNFHSTLPEIARVVRIGESTINKRLQEISMTDTATMTVEDIESFNVNSGDMDKMVAEGESADPPAFQRLQITDERRRRLRSLLTEKPDLKSILGLSSSGSSVDDDDGDSLTNIDVDHILRQITRSLKTEPVLGQLFQDLKNSSDNSFSIDVDLDADNPDSDLDQDLSKEERDKKKVIKRKQQAKKDKGEYDQLDTNTLLTQSFGVEGECETTKELFSEISEKVLSVKAPRYVNFQKRSEMLEEEGLDESEVNLRLYAQKFTQNEEEIDEYLVAEKKRMINRIVEECDLFRAELELGIDDVSDSEIEALLFNDEDVEKRTALWDVTNKEYLINLENKKFLEEQGLLGKKRGPRESRKNEVKVSDKINYAALESLEGLETNVEAEEKEDDIIDPSQTWSQLMRRRNVKDESSGDIALKLQYSSSIPSQADPISLDSMFLSLSGVNKKEEDAISQQKRRNREENSQNSEREGGLDIGGFIIPSNPSTSSGDESNTQSTTTTSTSSSGKSGNRNIRKKGDEEDDKTSKKRKSNK